MLTAKDMRPGDLVTFISDLQTSDGPVSGFCESNNEGLLKVRIHGVENPMTFETEKVVVNFARNGFCIPGQRTKFGVTFWELE